MIVSYALTSGGGYVVLFDESAGAQLLEDFSPDFAARVDEQDLPGSNGKFRNPLGNIIQSMQLKFNQQYANKAACVASIRSMAALMGFGVIFHLQVVQDAEVQYYPNCVCTKYKPKLGGISADHILQVQGDTVTSTAP